MAAKEYLVEYEPKFLSLLKELCKIAPAISIVKSDDGETLSIKASTDTQSIGYHLQAPAACFNFEGKEASFKDFATFHNFYSSFKNETSPVNLSQVNNFIRLSTASQRFKYILSDRRAIPKAVKRPDFTSPEAEFILDNGVLNLLRNKGALVNADEITFKVLTDVVRSAQTSSKYGNVFESAFPFQTNVPENEDVTITISNSLVTSIPGDFAYTVLIKNDCINFCPNMSEYLPGVTLDVFAGATPTDGDVDE